MISAINVIGRLIYSNNENDKRIIKMLNINVIYKWIGQRGENKTINSTKGPFSIIVCSVREEFLVTLELDFEVVCSSWLFK